MRRRRGKGPTGWSAVVTVCFGAFMGQLDASIVTMAFPSLQREFGAPLAAVQWVALAYLLVLVGLVVAVGRVADALGRKLIYLCGFAVFSAASAACAMAPGLGWLVALRVVQAVGAAMLQANSVALVVTSVARHRMRAALGIQAAAQSLGLALGPVLGGVLVGTLGWRWVFWVNVPVGAVALVAGIGFLPRTGDRVGLAHFDWQGLILLGGSTTTLLLALSGLSGLALPGWATAALVATCAVTFAGFLAREATAPSPLVDLAVLRPKPVSVGLVGAMFAYLVLFGPLALFPQVLGDRVGAGLVLTALPGGFAIAALAAEPLLPRRLDERTRSLVGALTCFGALVALALAPTATIWVAAWLFALGLGLGVFIPANNATIMGAVPVAVSATGGGLVNMARGLGTALGVALTALCLHLTPLPGLPLSGPRLAIAVLALCAILVAVTGAVGSGEHEMNAA